MLCGKIGTEWVSEEYQKMSNENKKSSSVEEANNGGSFWQGLLGDKVVVLLLGIGGFFLLFNAVMFSGVDVRPSAWLFYLDIRYWSVHFALFLWIAAIWAILESTDLAEDYILFVRKTTVACVLLVIISALWSFFENATPTGEYSVWFVIAIVVAVCCVVRSLFLLYDYRQSGKEFIGMEEAKWFWGLSAFLCAGLLTIGIMYIIPVRTEIHVGMDGFVTDSFLMSCIRGLQELFRTGQGSFALTALGLLAFLASIAFIYVAGKWGLLFWQNVKRRLIG